MRIIDRSLQTVRHLNVVEEEALRLFVTGKTHAPELLSVVRAKQRWLACDCTAPAPVMHVALRDGGRLVLKNNPEAADHAPNCPFIKDEAENRNGTGASSQITIRYAPDSHIALHSEFQGARRGNPQQISRSNAISTPRPRALLSLLMSLVEAAELDSFTPSQPLSITDQYASLRKAAGRFVLSPGLPLDHVLDTRINRQRLISMANRLRDTNSFGKSRRYGLLMDVLENTGPRQLVLNDGTSMEFFGNAEALHGRPAPCLALATVATQDENSNFYQLGKVAFVPMLSSRHLFPVVDDADRENVRAIFELLDWLLRNSVAVTAKRNLFQGGSGHLLTLKAGGTLLELDLNPTPLGNTEGPSGILSLTRLGSIDSLKKRVVSILKHGGSVD